MPFNPRCSPQKKKKNPRWRSRARKILKVTLVKGNSQVEAEVEEVIVVEEEAEEDTKMKDMIIEGIKCYNCGKSGHIVAKCWEKEKGNQQANIVEGNEEEGSLFLTYLNPNINNSIRLKVQLGDGKAVQIEGKGTIVIKTKSEDVTPLEDRRGRRWRLESWKSGGRRGGGSDEFERGGGTGGGETSLRRRCYTFGDWIRQQRLESWRQWRVERAAMGRRV
ncbi:hypothetical protein Pint_02708 [Pistacia integerrima]|uniref:Uncharacterized protein n=1 Tax=Pistacia integerrima TaxID=434235 RepID=A0ACC0ZQB5_9ROSI|nr:hypothetical protein Pint_02708 [Pistacia integerrima]